MKHLTCNKFVDMAGSPVGNRSPILCGRIPNHPGPCDGHPPIWDRPNLLTLAITFGRGRRG